MHQFCLHESRSCDCDDQFFIKYIWSYGDGQCITPWNRFDYQTVLPTDMYCQSRHDINHMCEASSRWRLWTLAKIGLCSNKFGYNDSILSMEQTNFSIVDQCIYLI
ncbi:unnamed protein product [Rotaria sp. Silwood1]|nr:unnamed protein product [Rotaria sp. Silwood1]CAF1344835.1 unnamed protein product [Rotaria sp. Silwood1]